MLFMVAEAAGGRARQTAGAGNPAHPLRGWPRPTHVLVRRRSPAACALPRRATQAGAATQAAWRLVAPPTAEERDRGVRLRFTHKEPNDA